MTPPRIDAHLHLPPVGPAGEHLFTTAHEAGIGILAVNSTCEQDWPTIIHSARHCPAVKPFLGIHPWWAHEVIVGWQERLLAELANTSAGIGEIGLDALASASPLVQETIFIPQLEMAETLARTVTIHCCRRWGRLIDLLNATCKKRSTVIIHGFNGSMEIMRRLLDIGAMLSFGPSLADPSRVKVRQAFQKAPLDRILFESDWPPRVSASNNHPGQNAQGLPTPEMILSNLYSVAATLKDISPQQLQTMVWNNGQILTH
ncbi:MAG: TatD family hydrolase [Proteobacteria bacterium]|nr:TatD family hydrolase [Pseudomonadota bacterium]